MNYKHILPLELNFKLKNLFKSKNVDLSEWINVTNDKYIYFLDMPDYGNIGDQAIGYAMRKFMSDFFPKYKQREVQQSKICYCLKQLKQIIKSDDIICLTGGGNMGVLYQRYEAIRRIILKNFPNNNIVIFPSTIDYGDTKYGIRELNKAKKIYNSHNKLICLAREEKSYNIMKNLFNCINVIKCPDIVLYLDYRNITIERKKSIGLCLRRDKEKAISDINLESEKASGYEVKEISTILESFDSITENNRKEVIENKLFEIASNKYMITDRLHGMIFAFITNTNCIALPNSNGKVEGVYAWIKGKGKIKFEKEYDGKFASDNIINENLKKDFENLANKIKEMIF